MTTAKRLCVVTALLGACSVPQLAQAGPILAGHEYQLVNADSISWTAANTAATSAGWYLATVTSATENDFIVSNLLAGLAVIDRSHYWIGATDAASEGTFTWVTGEAFAYTNWWSGEPNNSGNEDSVAFDLRGESWKWNDAPDNISALYPTLGRGYIAERLVPTAVPEPATLGLLGLGLLVGFARRKRG